MKFAEDDHPNPLLPLKGMRVFDLSRLLPAGPAAYSIPPPRMGQDSGSVLQQAGFSLQEIQLLEEEGIIHSAPIIPTPLRGRARAGV